ncbi:MAG: F0F1 ATP synthase subunit gamma [Propionibacteriaceae bacterium]|jgi:F-type H+-transporting ATPase subunit gamma|nr:F0F1 ATP synthase subunit gamma [Propionibacteriaceae bacterium]
MPASLRELRERNRSVQATQKITRAMELIAASRISRAQQAAQSALPYTRELNRAVAAVAAYSDVRHPLTTEPQQRRRSAVLILTSDRGLAGAYSSNVMRLADRLTQTLVEEGSQPEYFIVGRKGLDHFRYRQRPVAEGWEGFSDKPTYAQSDLVADRLIEAFSTDYESGGVDEIQVVYTRFESMLTQTPRVRRVLPLEVVRGDESVEAGLEPLYLFEPDPETVLDSLLPLYVRNRIHFYLMQSAASELASKQKAMKSATDNAQQLIEDLTRQANQARQAQITQEITEIVGGAQALSQTKTTHE